MLILPQYIMSLIKKVTALVAAVILMIVGFDEINMPDPDGAEIVGKTRYVLLDAKVTSQGVTNDGEYYYFSGNKHLGKADIETGEILNKFQGKSKLVEYLKEDDNYTDFYSKLEKLLNES